MEDYKEKYENALEWIKDIYPTLEGAAKEDAEHYFPELKESEDERIRKEILEYFQQFENERLRGVNISDWIAWLGKQGNFIKWQTNSKDNKPEKKHSVLIQTTHGIAEGEWQGEQWYQYRWSSIVRDSDVLSWIELSELEKQGEQNPTNKIKPRFKLGDTIRPKGSMAEYTIESISGECYHGKGWGLSISCDEDYELVEQKPAWSEEDEIMLNNVVSTLEPLSQTTHSGYAINSMINWLKSIKERYTWKPSDEQMESLLMAEKCVFTECDIINLRSLYNDLKKL